MRPESREDHRWADRDVGFPNNGATVPAQVELLPCLMVTFSVGDICRHIYTRLVVSWGLIARPTVVPLNRGSSNQNVVCSLAWPTNRRMQNNNESVTAQRNKDRA